MLLISLLASLGCATLSDPYPRRAYLNVHASPNGGPAVLTADVACGLFQTCSYVLTSLQPLNTPPPIEQAADIEEQYEIAKERVEAAAASAKPETPEPEASPSAPRRSVVHARASADD
jgi:hypothetical protein